MTKWHVTVGNMTTSDYYCGRNSKGRVPPPPADGWLGNPIRKGHGCPRCDELHNRQGSTLGCFEEYLQERLLNDEVFQKHFEAAATRFCREDVRLACFCENPETCHTSVIREYMQRAYEGKSYRPPGRRLRRIRDEIEKLDKELLRVLSRRVELAKAAGETKAEMNQSLYDPERERELIEIHKNQAPGNIQDEDVRELFEAVTNICLSCQAS
jgi:chorismate mutase